MKIIEIKLLETSLFSVTMLLNLINDMLDLAKMENSKFNLNESYFNLNTIIFEVFDMIKFFTDQRNQKLTLKYENKLKNDQKIDVKKCFDELLGDKNRYMQILLNFISNSLKFTPDGGQISVVLCLEELQQH